MVDDIAACSKQADGAETLSMAARTLSMHDDLLPSPPRSPLAAAARASDRNNPQPAADSRGRGDNAQSPQPQEAAGHQRSGRSSSGSQSSDGRSSGRAAKRATPITERTDSDAADVARQRIGQAPDAGGGSGSNTLLATKSASERDALGDAGVSDFDGDAADEGVGFAWRTTDFSTAASEALAAMPSGVLPSMLVQQQPSPPCKQPVAAAPRIFWGAAQAQGEREHFEDRFTLQPEFEPRLPSAAGTSEPPDRKAAQPKASPSKRPAKMSYAAVFDGHGAAADAAQTAASRMHKLLAGELGACASSTSGSGYTSRDVEEALHRAFAAADFEILADAAQTGTRSGTTACVALQLGAHMYVAHAGDSAAVLDRGGRAEKLTSASDHKPDDPAERARIKAKGGRLLHGGQRVVSPSGGHSLNMARSLGDAHFKTPRRVVSATPDVRHVELTQQDSAIILASDGLWDVVSPKDVVSIVGAVLGSGAAQLKARARGDAAASLAHAAADALVGVALHRGTADNVTAVVGLVRWA